MKMGITIMVILVLLACFFLTCGCTDKSEVVSQSSIAKVKLIVMVKRKEGMTQEEFDEYWKEVHGPIVRNNVPGLIKYIQNHRIDSNENQSIYDGIAELYFKDMDAYNSQNEWYLSEGGEIIRNDIPNFMDQDKMVTFICEEVLIE